MHRLIQTLQQLTLIGPLFRPRFIKFGIVGASGVALDGSLMDYDGDGDDFEGIAGEIETLQEMLYEAIQLYADVVVGTPIAYNSHAHPYFFIDVDGSGESEDEEAIGDNRYNAFTARLLIRR